VAKHLDKFTAPFRHSAIPFLLTEVVTNGEGLMTDLLFRFANEAAANLLHLSAEELQGKRFTHCFPAQQLSALEPLAAVAFSGSTASLPFETTWGQTLTLTCYQPVYGAVCCILDTKQKASLQKSYDHAPDTGSIPAATIELGRGVTRCVSINQPFCALTGWSRTEFLNRFANDISTLVEPEDWPALLQALLDATRGGYPLNHEFRLRRKAAPSLWVNLRADIRPLREGSCLVHALFLDIDLYRRTRENLDSSAQQQAQMKSLFKDLSGCCCLLRQEGPSLSPVLVSGGLLNLLGCTQAEFNRRLNGDILWRMRAADREEFSAAAAQAMTSGTPLRCDCHLRVKGKALWLSLEMVRHPQQDGSTLLYVSCLDRTADAEQLRELQFRSQLCDLLLERSRTLSLDYDPATDTIRIERHNDTGHRITRVIENYRTSLSEATVIHPDDRKKLAAAVKRLSSKSGAETLEYRGDYDGQGWRWYRLSWMSVFDSKGNVTRLLGKGEDVSQTKAAAEHFRTLVARQKKPPSGVLASARLDLASDRILDAKGSSSHLSQVLFGNTADACLRHLRDNIPDEESRSCFNALFRRDTLLAAFHRGEHILTLEHPFIPDQDSASIRVRTIVELAEDPDTLHITAFCSIFAL